jgi:hypothetical protein
VRTKEDDQGKHSELLHRFQNTIVPDLLILLPGAPARHGERFDPGGPNVIELSA